MYIFACVLLPLQQPERFPVHACSPDEFYSQEMQHFLKGWFHWSILKMTGFQTCSVDCLVFLAKGTPPIHFMQKNTESMQKEPEKSTPNLFGEASFAFPRVLSVKYCK